MPQLVMSGLVAVAGSNRTNAWDSSRLPQGSGHSVFAGKG
jgi:hypothetical protein